MRFGVCAPLEQGKALAKAGYDYVEPAVFPTLRPEQPEADVMPALAASVTDAPLRPETWNVFLPGDLKVTGGDVDEARQVNYLENAFSRAAALGGRIIVFGSGGARNVPTGFPGEDAQRQLKSFLGRAGDAAARHGMAVAIEPLNTGECNVIHSVGEAVELAHALGHPCVGVLSDLYHITVEEQSYDETRRAGPLLLHVHVAGAVGRRAPCREDMALLTAYFQALKAGGYNGRISVEGQWDDLPTQAGETLAVLREAWAS